MALNILTQQNVDVVAAESPENALESQLFGEEYEKLFRPSLADRLQVTFAILWLTFFSFLVLCYMKCL